MKLLAKSWKRKVLSGDITAVPNQLAGFLMIGQELDCLVEYKGKQYRAVKWWNDSYVELILNKRRRKNDRKKTS